jgi:hypothetical protein
MNWNKKEKIRIGGDAMENDQREEMPNFDSLNDRLINTPAEGPFIGIKTELDLREQSDLDPTQNRILHNKVTERMDSYFVAGEEEQSGEQ